LPAGVVLPQLVSGLDIEGEKGPTVVDLVEAIAIHDGRGEATQETLTIHVMLSMPSLPVRVASNAASIPISLPSRFSSPCDRMAYFPFTTRPVFMPCLATTRLQTGSPVSGFIANAAPSAPLVMSRRMPLTVTTFMGP